MLQKKSTCAFLFIFFSPAGLWGGILQSVALSGWAFLPNQTDCHLKCLNGGVCAFDRDDFNRHKCICFVGMFYGEQCEFVVENEKNNELINDNKSSSPSDEDSNAEGALKAGISDPEIFENFVENNQVEYPTTSNGIGGSFDDDDIEDEAQLSDNDGMEEKNEKIDSQKMAKSEELSYESEALLNDIKSSTPETLSYAGEEVELLKSEEYKETRDRDAYGTIITPTNSASNNEIYQSNIVAPNNIILQATTPSLLTQESSTPIDNVGMGGNLLTDEEFHANSNIKRYEESTRVAQPQSQTRYVPSTDTTTEIHLPKFRRKYHKVQTTTISTISSENNDEDVNDGWMISGKRRSASRVTVSSANRTNLYQSNTSIFLSITLSLFYSIHVLISKQF